MKTLLSLVIAAAVVMPVSAAEGGDSSAEKTQSAEQSHAQGDERYDGSSWPAYFAVWQVPHAPDVVGLRITIPYSTSQENVTGIDLGLWGHSLYFEGIQVNVLRNDVVDDGAGIQIGLYNSIGHGDMLGLQVGLWNEALCLRGIQVGLINVTGDAEGFQIGLINRAESLHGYQIGVINVIRSAEIQFFPVLNIGF